MPGADSPQEFAHGPLRQFASDNVAGAMPEVIEALIAANARDGLRLWHGPCQPRGRRPHPRGAGRRRGGAVHRFGHRRQRLRPDPAAPSRMRRCWRTSTPISAPTRRGPRASSAGAWG
ncbi:hypothetical protein ACRAWD_01435 [Caulobacter segnis]